MVHPALRRIAWLALLVILGSPLAREAAGRDAVLLTIIDPTPTSIFGPQSAEGFADGLATVFFGAAGQLWKTDGTVAGTVQVTAFRPFESGRVNSSVYYPTEVNGTLLFLRYLRPVLAVPWWELYRSDGTAEGTIQLATASGFLGSVTKVGDTFFFSASVGYLATRALWASDGTAAGTRIVTTFDSRPHQLTGANGLLFFAVSDAAAGEELWRSDGTAAGTVRVRDINPGPTGSSPQDLVAMGGLLFFRADDGVGGLELWRSDGTEAGTVRVKDINPGPEGSGTGPLVPLDGTLFFFADGGLSGPGLWRSDGTEAGTTYVTAAPSASALTAVGPGLFFAVGGVAPLDLWKSDGTAAGTALVKAGVVVGSLTGLDGTLYFVGRDALHGDELWRSGGSDASTTLVRDITPGAGGNPAQRVRVGGRDTVLRGEQLPGMATDAWRRHPHRGGDGTPCPGLRRRDGRGAARGVRLPARFRRRGPGRDG
jgi:ELWxxDGT repeat protein